MGELAALGTAVLWTFTSIVFSIAGHEIGPLIVNRIRLVMAVIFLALTHLIMQGSLVPLNAEPGRWLWLGISGIIGLMIGDACLFQALVLIGPRLSTLVMAVVPVISTFLAWLFLGEVLTLPEIIAVMITIAGIAWVVMERGERTVTAGKKGYRLGILYALGGALGQAGGLITAKYGLQGDFPVLSGVLIRMIVAMVAMWILAVLQKEVGQTLQATRNRRGMIATAAGSFGGPFLGVWLSLVAVTASRIGIASTLMALSPVLILPISHWVMKERVSRRAVFGTVAALAGVALIFMVG